jgi:hypothetical protein
MAHYDLPNITVGATAKDYPNTFKKSTGHSRRFTRVIPPGYRYASNIKNDKAV